MSTATSIEQEEHLKKRKESNRSAAQKTRKRRKTCVEKVRQVAFLFVAVF